MDAKEYLKSIDCFNTIYLKRDKDSNTMAKIMESYANEVVKKMNYTHCCKGEAEQYYCEIHKEEMTYDTNVNEHFCWTCEHGQQ